MTSFRPSLELLNDTGINQLSTLLSNISENPRVQTWIKASIITDINAKRLSAKGITLDIEASIGFLKELIYPNPDGNLQFPITQMVKHLTLKNECNQEKILESTRALLDRLPPETKKAFDAIYKTNGLELILNDLIDVKSKLKIGLIAVIAANTFGLINASKIKFEISDNEEVLEIQKTAKSFIDEFLKRHKLKKIIKVATRFLKILDEAETIIKSKKEKPHTKKFELALTKFEKTLRKVKVQFQEESNFAEKKIITALEQADSSQTPQIMTSQILLHLLT